MARNALVKAAKPLTPAQQRAIQALAMGASYAEAAAAASSKPETIRRWLDNVDAFRKALRAQQHANLEHVLLDLDSAAFGAIQVLLEQMRDVTLDPKVRQTAAKAVLDKATFARQRIEVTAPKTVQDLDPSEVARGALAYLAAQGPQARDAVARALLASPEMKATVLRTLDEMSTEEPEVLQAEFYDE